MKYFRQLYKAVSRYIPPSNLTELGNVNSKNLHQMVFPTHPTPSQLDRYVTKPIINQRGRYVIMPGVNPDSKKDPMINDIIYEFDPHYMS